MRMQFVIAGKLFRYSERELDVCCRVLVCVRSQEQIQPAQGILYNDNGAANFSAPTFHCSSSLMSGLLGSLLGHLCS